MSATQVCFDHLDAMTDERGLFEHASMTAPRPEHGYCTDDNARLLLIAGREPDEGVPARLHRVALAFTVAAQDPDGRTRNRMDRRGRWTDVGSTDDCWGRSVWALGANAATHSDPQVAATCLAAFEQALQQRSPWARAMAFAALGAAEVATVAPGHVGARRLLADALVVIGRVPDRRWAWPERTLRYANAALAEATIVAGAALGDDEALAGGLTMLRWLLDRETRRGHLSVTGVGGSRGDHDPGPRFDQQPIEVAAMADACWRAVAVTGDRSWWRGVEAAWAWFEGANDVGVVMRDVVSGGGFDGLHAHGVNRNQGAESTLALVSVGQRAQAAVAVR